MVLYVPGAGATRGAQFVKTSANPCFPPLDTDFYTQIQRVRNPKHASLVRQVAADAVDMFGTNFRLTLEAMFTTLEHTARMLEATGESRDFPKRELLDRRQRLMQAIAAVFEESLTQRREGHKELSSLTPRLCGYHERMVKRMRQGETIISFNYDCLIDTTLREYGSEKWNAHYGYGLNLGSRGARVTGDEYWQPKTPASRGEHKAT